MWLVTSGVPATLSDVSRTYSEARNLRRLSPSMKLVEPEFPVLKLAANDIEARIL